MFVFLGVHFTAFGVLECSKCLYHKDTKFELCFIYFLYNESKFSLVKKKWYELFTNCNVLCMPTWHSRNSQIRTNYALLAIISSQHTQQRIWKKLAHCRVLFVAVRMFTRHTLDFQHSVLNCECSWQTASTSDGFLPISSCPLPVEGQFSYIWNDQHTCEQHNKGNTLPTSVCASSCHADSRKHLHFHSCMIWDFERGVNEICALLGFCATSIGSFLPTF
jgi:hypothetical protein